MKDELHLLSLQVENINKQIMKNEQVEGQQQLAKLSPVLRSNEIIAVCQGAPLQVIEFSKASFFVCSSLYVLQGIVVSIGVTMPYVYPLLPTYETLTLFNAIDLPFSFKFLIAPFLEKFTSLSYGKRKFWIIISQLLCASFLLLGSFHTTLQEASFIAVLLLFSEFLITIQDISLDSLTIKQMKCPKRSSLVQAIAQSCGVVTGSLLILKLTSHEFALKIGLDEPIATPSTMIKSISLLLVTSAIIVHFNYKETTLKCEEQSNKKSVFEILSYFWMFCNLKSKYCRTGIFMLFLCQGINFFDAGYDYELVKAGFSRDTSNSITNLITIPIIFLSYYMVSWTNKLGLKRSMIYSMSLLSILYTFMIVIFPVEPLYVGITRFMGTVLSTWRNMILYIMCNSFPLHGLSGMFITILYSICNFGTLKAISTSIISVFGWYQCSMVGIFIQIIIILNLSKFYEWIEQGSLDIEEMMQGPSNPSSFIQNPSSFAQNESIFAQNESIFNQQRTFSTVQTI